MTDKSTPGTRGRCCWEVVAGVLPGTPIPEHTRRWIITGECWEKENKMTDEEFKAEHPDGRGFFKVFAEEAQEYARTLYDPRCFNWVRIDWIWF